LTTKTERNAEASRFSERREKSHAVCTRRDLTKQAPALFPLSYADAE